MSSKHGVYSRCSRERERWLRMSTWEGSLGCSYFWIRYNMRWYFSHYQFNLHIPNKQRVFVMRRIEFRKNSLVWQRRKTSKVVCQQDIVPLSCEKILQPDRKAGKMCGGKMCRWHGMGCGINGEEIKGFQSNRCLVAKCFFVSSENQWSTDFNSCLSNTFHWPTDYRPPLIMWLSRMATS